MRGNFFINEDRRYKIKECEKNGREREEKSGSNCSDNNKLEAGANKGIGGWIRMAYMLLGVSISFFVIMIIYIIIHTLIIARKRGKEERIKGILKEAKKIEEKIKE